MRRPRRVHLLLLLLALSLRTAAAQYSYAQPHHQDVVAQLQSHARSATHPVEPRLHTVALAPHFSVLRVILISEPRAALEVPPAQPFTAYTTTIPPPAQFA